MNIATLNGMLVLSSSKQFLMGHNIQLTEKYPPGPLHCTDRGNLALIQNITILSKLINSNPHLKPNSEPKPSPIFKLKD